ncbi:alpha/beta hydrolase [Altererythrobacter sp. SALINAS58]|nr:alpha/beta hydrolase [Alteripontixanthobacter muriae]
MLAAPAETAVTIPAASEMPIVFEASDGSSVPALRGSLQVLERRGDPDSRQITLHYVRFPATTAEPGAPIVYLAGGPGGSGIGTAKGERFSLFMALREFGDVIAFDQRGTGEASDLPDCTSNIVEPGDRVLSDTERTGLYRAAARECAAFWEGNGIDLKGYSTLESAADLDDLRSHLGAEKISLWGISYGTHLALAAMKTMPERLDRVILASAEGLAQTVKLPARTDAYFMRLQKAIDKQPAARAMFPDIRSLMDQVHRQLDAEPISLSVIDKDGKEQSVLITRATMQGIAAGMIADPASAAILLHMYREIAAGGTGMLHMVIPRYFMPGGPIRLSAMPTAMDVASGISEERLTLVTRQGRTALLGLALNFPMPQIRDELSELDLGDGFREEARSDVPTLLLTGTLDGRTYPDAQLEAVAGLSNLSRVTIENAGHNLFTVSPEVLAAINAFFRGTEVPDTIIAPLPDFTSPIPEG